MKDERPQAPGSRIVYESKVFKVREDRVATGGGSRVMSVVEHPGSYAIVAQPDPGTVILIRQYRYAAGRTLWELPAGTAVPGEEPQAGALRELREETGYRAARIRQIFTTYMTPGYCDESIRYYHAEQLEAGETEFDEDENIETRVLPVDEALAFLSSGEILDAKTFIGLLWLDGLRRQQFR